jgi:hypothetical protein
VVLQLGGWEGASNPRTGKPQICDETGKRASDQDGFCGKTTQAPKKWMRVVIWNFRGLYRIGSFKTVVRELGKYKLDTVGGQEVRWEKGGTERAEDYTFFYGREVGIIRNRFFSCLR